MRLLLGPRYDGPSCRLPYTLYGLRRSTATRLIWALGRLTWNHDVPWFVEMFTYRSLATRIRFALVGSNQMS
jgi:hypothetical protein